MEPKTWKVRRGTIIALIAGSLLVGAILGPPLASSHVTQNIAHLGNHIWEKVIKPKVYTRKQSNSRFAAKAHNHDSRYAVQERCLDGGVSRAVQAPGLGDLIVNEVMARPAAPLTEASAEWFELHALAPVDLNGLQIGTGVGSLDVGQPSMTLSSPNCIEVPTGGFVLFARSADSGANGGLAPDHVFTFSLVNTASTLFLASDDRVVDRISLGAATQGSSEMLHSGDLTAHENDDPVSWCDSFSSYTTGNTGTPKAANGSCP